MCCLVLATNPGNGTRFGRRSPANWTNRGWLSLVRDRGWLSLDRNRRWLCLDPEGLYIRFPGSVTCGVWRPRVALSEFVFVDSSYVHARLLLRCRYSRVTRYSCPFVVDITVTFQFSFVCLYDRTCVYRTVYCVRVASTTELNLRTLLYINCITYWVFRDVV